MNMDGCARLFGCGHVARVWKPCRRAHEWRPSLVDEMDGLLFECFSALNVMDGWDT